LGLATANGPPERIDPTKVDSRKLRSRSVHVSRDQPITCTGTAPRFEIKGPTRLPARQNSNYGHHNLASVCVNLRVDDSFGNKAILSYHPLGRCACSYPQPPDRHRFT